MGKPRCHFNMHTGEIYFKLEGITHEATLKFHDIIRTLFEQGVFSLRNGKAILDFNENGILVGIKMEIYKWKKGAPSFPQLDKPFQFVIIDSEQGAKAPSSDLHK